MSEGLFLSRAELEVLTGYKVRPCQIRWLQKKGIPLLINAQGQIVVRRDYDKGHREADDFVMGEVR
jgi:hypothetical protein